MNFNKARKLQVYKKWLFLGLCLIAFSPLGCGLFDQKEDKIVIVAGSRSVTTDELKKDLEFIGSGIDVSSLLQNQVINRLVERLIDQYLIIEYGREQGLSVSEKEVQKALTNIKTGHTEGSFEEELLRGYVEPGEWEKRLREQLLIDKILKKVLEEIVPPGRQEIKQYLEDNLGEYTLPRMVKFRQILTRTEKEAEALLKRLHDGEEMGKLAKEKSIAPEAKRGGMAGWVAEGCLEETMEKTLFSMPQGKISPVTKTPYGYHIFEVLSVQTEGVKALQEVSAEIESKLFEKKRAAFCKQWLAELRRHFGVKINQELINISELR